MLLGLLLLPILALGGFLLVPGKTILIDRRVDMVLGTTCWISVVILTVII